MVIHYEVQNVFNFDFVTSQSVMDTHSSVNVICNYGLPTEINLSLRDLNVFYAKLYRYYFMVGQK